MKLDFTTTAKKIFVKTMSFVLAVSIISLSGVRLILPAAAAERFENVQIFGPLPGRDDGRQVGDCIAGLMDFLYVSIGSGFASMGSDFTDYWRDFFLAPSHFNDVYGLELQENKARYEVIGTFLRCDVSRFDAVKKQYYKLAEEHYFVRHFIDTLSVIGQPSYDDRITNDARRRAFSDEVVEYIMRKTPKRNEEQQRALYSGYFDNFVGKYQHKIEQYRTQGYADDPDVAALKDKVKKLQDTIESFQNVTDEISALGNDVAEGAKAVKESFVPEHSTSGSGLYDLIAGVASRFDVCAEMDEDRYCASDALKHVSAKDALKRTPEERLRNMFKTSNTRPKSFGEVIAANDESADAAVQSIDEAEMLTRYEILYGRVNGSGVRALIEKVDNLNTMLKAGSIPPLTNVYECADFIEDKQCQ